MFRSLIVLLILSMTVGAASVLATPKNLSAGAGAYVVTTSEGDERSNMEGYAFTGTLALGPGSAARGHLYFTEDEDDANLKLDGFDAQFLLGSNLNRVGFKIYALGGYWKESSRVEFTTTAKSAALELDFSGFMAGLGIGYNWASATLDFWAAWRQPDEYKDFIEGFTGVEPDITMGAGALSFGLRF